jgi:hypothetical protein
MGSSSSKTTTNIDNDTLIVNSNDISVVSKSLNDFSTSTVMNAANNCSASSTNLQNINLSGGKFKGGLNFGADQSQTATVSFSCINATDMSQDIASGMVAQMMTNLNTNASSDTLTKMDAAANSALQKGFDPISNIGGSVSSDANTNITNKFKSVNTNKKSLENVVKNVVTNKFDANMVSNCIADVNNQQQINLSNVEVDGNTNLKFSQTQVSNLMSNCVNKTNIGSKVTNAVAATLGVVTSDTVATKLATDLKATAKAETVTTGPIQDVGSAVSQAAQGIGTGVGTAAKGIGEGIGSVFSGLFGGSGISIVCSVVLCIIFVIVGLYFSGMLGGGGEEHFQELSDKFSSKMKGGSELYGCTFEDMLGLHSPVSLSAATHALDLN